MISYALYIKKINKGKNVLDTEVFHFKHKGNDSFTISLKAREHCGTPFLKSDCDGVFFSSTGSTFKIERHPRYHNKQAQ